MFDTRDQILNQLRAGEGVRKILEDGEAHSGRRPKYELFGDETPLDVVGQVTLPVVHARTLNFNALGYFIRSLLPHRKRGGFGQN